MRRLAALVAVLALAACAPQPPGQLKQSALARDLKPSLASADQKTLVDGNTDFAFDLLRAADPGNLAVSPFSVSSALAMTYAGARGDTATQMAGALHFTLPGATLHAGFDWLDLGLQLGDKVRIANALFAQTGLHLESPFLDTLKRDYGTGVYLLDFAKKAEDARTQIDGWVSAVTNGKIPNILAPGDVDAATRFVLVNAVYLNCTWKRRFDPARTKSATFHLDGGASASVPTMHQAADLAYARGNGWQMVALPYAGVDLEMDLILPDAGTLDALTAHLDAATFDAMVHSLDPGKVDLSLPRFTVESALPLGRTLEGFGMTDAFDPAAADFSGIDGGRDLHLTKVVHKAYVRVDESGTEAAAATAVVGAGAVYEPAVPLAFDRPFLFVIRHPASGTVLFVGRVMDPR